MDNKENKAPLILNDVSTEVGHAENVPAEKVDKNDYFEVMEYNEMTLDGVSILRLVNTSYCFCNRVGTREKGRKRNMQTKKKNSQWARLKIFIVVMEHGKVIGKNCQKLIWMFCRPSLALAPTLPSDNFANFSLLNVDYF